MNSIKTIFAGTPDFALPALKALYKDADFKIQAVITQPDMPIGRKQVITAPPVKELAVKYQIENIWQPQNIIQVMENIRKLQPDIIVIAAYAQIIPPDVLRLPKYGCLNVHASLLPKYRGASPIHAVILNNEKETGVTIMVMDETLDTGPILSQAKTVISSEETTVSLYDRLAEAGAKLLIPTIKKYIKGKIEPQPQDDSKANYVHQIKKSDGLIDWQKSAQEIERFVRALGHWPGAWTWVKGKQLKITHVQHEIITINSQKIGKTFMYNNGLAIQCGKDALIIEKLQIQGKNELSSKEFLNGNQDFIGSILG
ncbi:MAG: methionyl-tRNA formyltransferase [bacterium]